MAKFQRIVKGWYVEGFRTGEDGEPEKLRSRLYHVKSAADAYAAALRLSTDLPGSVNVRTKEGFDKLEGDHAA